MPVSDTRCEPAAPVPREPRRREIAARDERRHDAHARALIVAIEREHDALRLHDDLESTPIDDDLDDLDDDDDDDDDEELAVKKPPAPKPVAVEKPPAEEEDDDEDAEEETGGEEKKDLDDEWGDSTT